MTLRVEKYYTLYNPEDDVTFIMHETCGTDGMTISLEVVGFHVGAPDENSEDFIGKLKAEF